MEVLPAIDLRHGKVVRLRQGDDRARTVYDDDPLAVLVHFVDTGIRRVHVVDLDAALGEEPQRDLLRRLAATFPRIQLGGGLRSREAVAWALEEAGCQRAVLGSLLGRDPEGFADLARTYPGRIVPALDLAQEEVRIAGWREGAVANLQELCRRLRDGPCPAVLVTDILRDGTLEGPNLELAATVSRAAGLPALLSGGIRSLKDLEEARRLPEIAGVIIGRALYEGRFTLKQALEAAGDGGSP